MANRLPVPGQDNGVWGAILNNFLGVEHKADGTLKIRDEAVFKGDLLLNVKDYGAVGDGSNDDTAAINRAITAANTAGEGLVFLPAGTYIVSSQLTALASKVYASGVGSGTVIKLASSFSGATVFSLTNDYAGVRGVYFIGGPSGTPSSNPAANMITVTAAKNCTVIDIDSRAVNGYIIEALGNASRGPLGLTIDNIRGTDIGYGIHTKGHSSSGYGIQASITNINMQLVMEGDVLFIEDSWDVLIMNVNACVTGTLSSNASDLRIHGRSATVLCFNIDVGSYPTHPGGTPAVLIESGTNGEPENINLIGGIFQQSLEGLRITAGDNIFVQGVRMQENGTHGANISGGSTIQINNCMFSANGQTAGTGRYDAYVNTTNSPITFNRCEFLTDQGTTAGHVDNVAYHASSAKAVWEFCNFTGSGFTIANVFSGLPGASLFNGVGGGALGINLPPSSAFANNTCLPIYTASSGAAGIVVRGSSGQTNDLLRMEDSSATKIANFDANGNVFGQRLFSAPNAAYFTGPGGVSGSLNGNYQSGSNIGMLLQRTSSATGDMADFVDNNNNILAKVDYLGAGTFTGLAVNGALSLKRTTVSDASYDITANDYLVAYTSLSTGRTVTLPTAVGITGRVYVIVDETGSANTNNITVATTSSQTINGATTRAINTAFGSLKVYSNGANWIITP